MEVTETPTGTSPEENAFQEAESEVLKHYEDTVPDTRTPAYGALLHQVTLDERQRRLDSARLISQLRNGVSSKSGIDEDVEVSVQADMAERKAREEVEELQRIINSHAGRDAKYAQEVSIITGFRKSLAEGYAKAKMVGHPSGGDAARTVLAKTLTQVKTRPATMTTTKM